MKWRIGAAVALSLVLVQMLTATDPRFGGTFIGAIICTDGILIGADSRSTFIDGSGKHIGYVDGISKIFAQTGTAFAVSGLSSMGSELFPAFLRRNDYLLSKPSTEVLYDVFLHLPFNNATNVVLISAGYVDGESMICAKDPTTPQNCQKNGMLTNKPSPSLRRWQATVKGEPSLREAAVALKQAILESASGDSTVGGPVALLHLRKNAAPAWIENGSQDGGWTQICDIVSDYRRNKTAIGFTNSREELDRFLLAVCPGRK